MRIVWHLLNVGILTDSCIQSGYSHWFDYSTVIRYHNVFAIYYSVCLHTLILFVTTSPLLFTRIQTPNHIGHHYTELEKTLMSHASIGVKYM